jgi:hypothetical protein
MNKIHYALLFVSFITVFNCEKDNNTIETASIIPPDKVELLDGTLAFLSVDFLTRQVDEIKEMEDIQKEQFLYFFYDKGFQPEYCVDVSG